MHELLVASGAFLQAGHFVLNSGVHSPQYVAKDRLFLFPDRTLQAAGVMAHEAFQAGPTAGFPGFDVVCGPAVGGAILAQTVAWRLRSIQPSPPLAVFADKVDGGKALKRGYDKIVQGKRVLVVEDVVTSGDSTLETIEAVRGAGGRVEVVVSLVCRRASVTHKTFGVSVFIPLLRVSDTHYDPDDCPLCRTEIPVDTEHGHGAAFLRQRNH